MVAKVNDVNQSEVNPIIKHQYNYNFRKIQYSKHLKGGGGGGGGGGGWWGEVSIQNMLVQTKSIPALTQLPAQRTLMD